MPTITVRELRSHFSRLPTLEEMRCKPQAVPKPLPRVLVKKEKQQTKKQIEDAFRKAVWLRDKGVSRASRKPLKRSGTNWDSVGEVHHVVKRSTSPEGKFEPSRGILLSKSEHAMAETRCPNDQAHFLLEIVGPDDLGLTQLFTFRDIHGAVIRTRQG